MKTTLPKKTTYYAVKAKDGKGYLAIQGDTHWFQDEPKGWALFVTREYAQDALETHHSALGTAPEQGGEIVTVELT